MLKIGIDQNALIEKFTQAATQQGDALRKAVSEATLKALQGREATLANVRSVLKTIAQATAATAEKSGLPAADVEKMLDQAIAGMDSALLQTVEANRRALQQFVDQGVALRETKLKGALADLRKLEDVFITTLSKATPKVGLPLQGPWSQALQSLQSKGSSVGASASSAVERLMNQTQAAVRQGQEFGDKAAKAMLDSYAALVSGVLIGMSEGLQQGGVGTGGSVAAEPPDATGSAARKTASKSAARKKASDA